MSPRRESYLRRPPGLFTEIEYCARYSTIEHRLSCFNDKFLSHKETGILRKSLFMSKVRWQFGVLTTCFAWSQKSFLLCTCNRLVIVKSLTTRAVAGNIECGSENIWTVAVLATTGGQRIFSVRVMADYHRKHIIIEVFPVWRIS